MERTGRVDIDHSAVEDHAFSGRPTADTFHPNSPVASVSSTAAAKLSARKAAGPHIILAAGNASALWCGCQVWSMPVGGMC